MREENTRGFTLIEVIVALAVLGIGLVVIIELFSGGLRLGKTSEEYTHAVAYARMKLEEISLAEQLQEGEEEGDFDSRFHWRLGVKRVDLLPGDKGAEFRPPVEFFHLTLDVSWKSGFKERKTVLESFKTLAVEAIEEKG